MGGFAESIGVLMKMCRSEVVGFLAGVCVVAWMTLRGDEAG